MPTIPNPRSHTLQTHLTSIIRTLNRVNTQLPPLYTALLSAIDERSELGHRNASSAYIHLDPSPRIVGDAFFFNPRSRLNPSIPNLRGARNERREKVREMDEQISRLQRWVSQLLRLKREGEEEYWEILDVLDVACLEGMGYNGW
jgi:hypothetical protein